MKFATKMLATALALTLPGAALAHHGWGWTEDTESRVAGTIVSITFGNPHMHLQLRNAEGTWEIDLSPPSIGTASGFGPNTAKPGDHASLTGHRGRDKALRFKAETITVRGKTFDVYPQREKSLRPAA